MVAAAVAARGGGDGGSRQQRLVMVFRSREESKLERRVLVFGGCAVSQYLQYLCASLT
jgi:hypothetical protein